MELSDCYIRLCVSHCDGLVRLKVEGVAGCLRGGVALELSLVEHFLIRRQAGQCWWNHKEGIQDSCILVKQTLLSSTWADEQPRQPLSPASSLRSRLPGTHIVSLKVTWLLVGSFEARSHISRVSFKLTRWLRMS